MISIEMVEKEIKELTNNGSMSWDTMEKLCWLFTVRDHLEQEYEGDRKIGFKGSLGMEGIKPTQSGELENIEQNMTREEIANEFNRHMDDIRNRHPMDYENTVRRMRENYNRRSYDNRSNYENRRGNFR